MGRVKTIARRSFLIGSAAVAGGVAFGVHRAFKDLGNPNLANLKEGAASFNPWVVIDDQNITLIGPHGDKGQGVMSAQVTLIAEELDVEPEQVVASFGKPDASYYNTAFAEAMAGYPLYVFTEDAERTRRIAGRAIRGLFPSMGTGGSTSMPDSFNKLRHAGAVARETLKQAASDRTGVPVSQLKTEKGTVVLPDGNILTYQELASAAADVRKINDVKLRDPSEWRLIGKPMKRIDMIPKVTGTMQYGIDVELENMLYAAIRVNPRQGGVMNSYDATTAKQMRGVSDIVEITGGVAVIADNTWRAIQASNAITFDWGPAPYPAEQADHWSRLEGAFNEEHLNAEARNDGDVLAAAGVAVTGEYRSPYVAHAPLEPLNATILVTDDRVDIWTGHQVQMFVESFVAEITGHDVENVHLHNQYMGGSFGHRLEFDFVKQAAEIANKKRGTPVKMTYSREEDFAHDFPRHITMGRGTGKHANGQVTSLDVEIAGQSVIKSQMGRMGLNLPGPDTQLHEGAWDVPNTNLPNIRVRSYLVTDLAPVSSWRSVGAAPNTFIYDTLLDETIHAAGADPLMERIRLMGHEPSVRTLEAVGEMSSWNGPKPAKNKGRGVAYGFSFGVPVAMIVEVENTTSGIRLNDVWVAADVGTVIDPENLTNMAEGGTVFGLGHAINCEITYSDGMAEQTNYHMHEAMRMYQCPRIHFQALENMPKVRGFGEPPVPPSAPALGNAIFAATGTRLREMPFNKFIDFV